MYLSKVYIRHKETYPDSSLTYSAMDGFQQLGVETAPFYGFGDLDTFEDIGPEVGVVGFVGDVRQALKRLGVVPHLDTYPEPLMTDWCMGRKVWKSTLGEIRRTVEPVFIKPVQEKLFTGFVWRGAGMEAVRIAPCEDHVEVWCSEPVQFVSEYRAYVKDDEILGVKNYKGDWAVAPNRSVIEKAVATYKSSPRALSLDFGITTDGRTLLVEANDGYALGNYGLPNPIYAGFLEARWEELTRRPQ